MGKVDILIYFRKIADIGIHKNKHKQQTIQCSMSQNIKCIMREIERLLDVACC